MEDVDDINNIGDNEDFFAFRKEKYFLYDDDEGDVVNANAFGAVIKNVSTIIGSSPNRKSAADKQKHDVKRPMLAVKQI